MRVRGIWVVGAVHKTMRDGCLFALRFFALVTAFSLVAATNAGVPLWYGFPFSEAAVAFFVVLGVHLAFVLLVLFVPPPSQRIRQRIDAAVFVLCICLPGVFFVVVPLTAPVSLGTTGIIVVFALFAWILHAREAANALREVAPVPQMWVALVAAFAFGSGSLGASWAGGSSQSFVVAYAVSFSAVAVVSAIVVLMYFPTLSRKFLFLMVAALVYYGVVMWFGSFHRQPELVFLLFVLALFYSLYAVFVLVVWVGGMVGWGEKGKDHPNSKPASKPSTAARTFHLVFSWFALPVYLTLAVVFYALCVAAYHPAFLALALTFVVLWSLCVYFVREANDASMCFTLVLSAAAWGMQLKPSRPSPWQQACACVLAAAVVVAAAVLSRRTQNLAASLVPALFATGLLVAGVFWSVRAPQDAAVVAWYGTVFSGLAAIIFALRHTSKASRAELAGFACTFLIGCVLTVLLF